MAWWGVGAAAGPDVGLVPPGRGLYLPVPEPLLLVGEERHRGACPAQAWPCFCLCPWNGHGGFSPQSQGEEEPLRPRVGAAAGRRASRRAAAVRLDGVLPPHQAEGASPGAGAGRAGRGAGSPGRQAAAAGRERAGRLPGAVVVAGPAAVVPAAGPGQEPVGHPPDAGAVVGPAAAEVAVGRPGAEPPGDAGRHRHRHPAFSSYHQRAAAGWSTRRGCPGQCARWVVLDAWALRAWSAANPWARALGGAVPRA